VRLRILTEPQQGASYGTLRRVAQAAEDLGDTAERHYDIPPGDHQALSALV